MGGGCIGTCQAGLGLHCQVISRPEMECTYLEDKRGCEGVKLYSYIIYTQQNESKGTFVCSLKQYSICHVVAAWWRFQDLTFYAFNVYDPHYSMNAVEKEENETLEA